MDTFENINDQIVYVKIKSKKEALSLKDKAKEATLSGKSVAIFFGDQYRLYLAPGHDPYQVRKDINTFLNNPPESTPEKTESKSGSNKNISKPQNTPARNASGKFVSKKQTSSPKKKGFWSSLR